MSKVIWEPRSMDIYGGGFIGKMEADEAAKQARIRAGGCSDEVYVVVEYRRV